MKLSSYLILLVLLSVVGCGGKNSPFEIEEEDSELLETEEVEVDADYDNCTDDWRAGIKVYVFDKETEEPISCGSSIIIGDGDYTETVTETNLFDGDLNCDSRGPLEGAHERRGIYTVIVSKLGYQDAIFTDVEVTRTICHVNTVDIEAYLSK